MSEAIAKRQIDEKRIELGKDGFILGAAKGRIQDVGSGGFLQVFENAHIYWHTNTGAHEVHGNILKKYLELGGPGANPATGRRDFGFPTTDEEDTPAGIPVSHFEFGTVYAVPGTGGVGLYGDLRKKLEERDHLPLLEPQKTPKGEILYCERGAIFKPKNGSDDVIRASLVAPDLGCPGLIRSGDDQDLPVKISYVIDSGSWQDLLDLAPSGSDKGKEALNLLVDHWENRLVLQSVRDKSLSWPISVEVGRVKESGSSRSINLVCRIDRGVSLPDRELFSLCFKRPDRKLVPVAPHCLYSRKNWDKFGLIHATDLHVSRRVEGFRAKLKAGGETGGARSLVNPNDSVRALINYANRLHALGAIDFIIATGDLVDYIYEKGDDRKGGGNFAYLKKLLQGQAPPKDKEGVQNQELHVPIFTVLGNHDYVLNSYELFFDIDIPVLNDPTIRKWSSFNLNRKEAEVLQGGKKITVSRDRAESMAESLKSPHQYYLDHINSKRSYVVELGTKHRIVMLDTGPNKDIISGIGDVLEKLLGHSNEDESTFVHGTPNTNGGGNLKVLRDTLNGGTVPGVTIVGMHSPPLNPWGNEYPHYLRESERPHLKTQRLKALVDSYIRRQTIIPGVNSSTWPRTGTKHFKSGDLDQLLDLGIVKWDDADSLELLKLCINKDVDLILCGHIHQRAEFRIQNDSNGGLLYFTDFYTENPPKYRESFDWTFTGNFGPPKAGDERPIHIQVLPKVKADEPVLETRDHTGDVTVVYRRQRVPVYADPLDKATNKKNWWSRHQPLILQTSCTGPIDFSQRGGRTKKQRVTFQGARLLTVNDDTITRINYLAMADIRAGKVPAWLDPLKEEPAVNPVLDPPVLV